MLRINILSVQALKGKQFVAFMKFVREAINNNQIISQWFQFYVARFMAAYDRLDEVFLKYDLDACTLAVQEADAVRNKAFRKMRDELDMCITYPESPEKKQAAEALMRVIHLYGGNTIPKMGQTAKTATLSNMVEDFLTKYPADVATAGIGADVEALKAAQQAYDEKYMARAVCESEVVKGAMTDARNAMTEAYRLLVDAINVKVYEDTDGALTDFISLLNVEIARNRIYTGQGQVGAGASSGSGSNADEGTEEDETPAPGELPETPDDNTPEGGGDTNPGNGGTTTTPPGSVPTNPQPGDGDDPDL